MYAAWSFKICERRRSLFTWILKQEQINKNKKPERERVNTLLSLHLPSKWDNRPLTRRQDWWINNIMKYSFKKSNSCFGFVYISFSIRVQLFHEKQPNYRYCSALTKDYCVVWLNTRSNLKSNIGSLLAPYETSAVRLMTSMVPQISNANFFDRKLQYFFPLCRKNWVKLRWPKTTSLCRSLIFNVVNSLPRHQQNAIILIHRP